LNLKEFVIPAIDLKGGKLVRLLRGEFGKEKVYGERPEEFAARFWELGFKRLHVVDLDGAKEGRPANLQVIRKIRKAFGGTIQAGGGIRTYETARILFEEGIDLVVVSTVAVKNPSEFERIIADFPKRVILAVDSKGGRVAVRGWVEATPLTPEEFAKLYEEKPLWGYLYTVIERDGSLEGIDPEPYRNLRRVVSKPLLASGGVSSVEDLKKLLGVVEGVVVGKAIYEGKIKPEEL